MSDEEIIEHYKIIVEAQHELIQTLLRLVETQKIELVSKFATNQEVRGR